MNTWTTDPPTVPGWYWWRQRRGKIPVVVELRRSEDAPDVAGSGNWMIRQRLYRPDLDTLVPTVAGHDCGEWCGPLSPPVESAPTS